MNEHILLKELVSDHYSADKDAYWLKFKTDQGIVIFWGELSGVNRNITSLRHQKLPLLVSVDDIGACEPSDYIRKEYGVVLSVPANISILIDSSLEA